MYIVLEEIIPIVVREDNWGAMENVVFRYALLKVDVVLQRSSVKMGAPVVQQIRFVRIKFVAPQIRLDVETVAVPRDRFAAMEPVAPRIV